MQKVFSMEPYGMLNSSGNETKGFCEEKLVLYPSVCPG